MNVLGYNNQKKKSEPQNFTFQTLKWPFKETFLLFARLYKLQDLYELNYDGQLIFIKFEHLYLLTYLLIFFAIIFTF
jgi:hypothetical protein